MGAPKEGNKEPVILARNLNTTIEKKKRIKKIRKRYDEKKKKSPDHEAFGIVWLGFVTADGPSRDVRTKKMANERAC